MKVFMDTDSSSCAHALARDGVNAIRFILGAWAMVTCPRTVRMLGNHWYGTVRVAKRTSVATQARTGRRDTWAAHSGRLPWYLLDLSTTLISCQRHRRAA
eukprot:1671743-Prymnesium_polylepis.1